MSSLLFFTLPLYFIIAQQAQSKSLFQRPSCQLYVTCLFSCNCLLYFSSVDANWSLQQYINRLCGIFHWTIERTIEINVNKREFISIGTQTNQRNNIKNVSLYVIHVVYIWNLGVLIFMTKFILDNTL